MVLKENFRKIQDSIVTSRILSAIALQPSVAKANTVSNVSIGNFASIYSFKTIHQTLESSDSECREVWYGEKKQNLKECHFV